MRTLPSIQRVILTCAIALFLTIAVQADPTGWPYPDTVTAPWCTDLIHDFHLESPDCELWHYEILSGPGYIGEYTGIWEWYHVNDKDTGTFDLALKIRNYCGGGEYNDTVAIHITGGSIEITSGGGTFSMLTGEAIQRQFTATTEPCPPTNWSCLRRGPFTTEYSIDENGLFTFAPSTTGTWTFDIRVGSYIEMSEAVTLAYIVHGGSGCCAGSRGDITADGLLDLSDLSRLIAYMTSPNIVLNCWDEANIDAEGSIDLTDLSMLINFMVDQGAVPLPICP